MRAKFIVASVSIAALLGASACTTTDPYSSTPNRNNTGTGHRRRPGRRPAGLSDQYLER